MVTLTLYLLPIVHMDWLPIIVFAFLIQIIFLSLYYAYLEGSFVSLLSLASNFSRFCSLANDSGREVSSFFDTSIEVSCSHVMGTES